MVRPRRETLKICAQPGCPELTKSTRCDRHRKEKRRVHDKRRPTASERGYGRKWARTRRAYLKHFPHCQHPGCIHPAEDVHHLDGQGPLGALGHTWSNLMALCKSHHSQTTAREQPGGFMAHGGGGGPKITPE